MRVIVRAAQEAGLSSRCEPDTHSLLLGEFSKADCRRVFPKATSKAYKTAFEKLSQALIGLHLLNVLCHLNKSKFTSKTKLICFLFIKVMLLDLE